MITARNRVLHICPPDGKFIPPFIEFVEAHFEDFAERHLFYISGDSTLSLGRLRDNIIQQRHGKLNKLTYYSALARSCHEADKIILHSLLNSHLLMMLAIIPWVLPKCYWAIWGGDLYAYKLRNFKWRWKAKEVVRRRVFSRIGHIIGDNIGDVHKAVQIYKMKEAEIHASFMYTSNVMASDQPVPAVTEDCTNILLGNSADPTNNHFSALSDLQKFSDKKINIFCPLSYGDMKYADEVACYGNSIFGNKFRPLREFLPLNEWQNILDQVDVGIFAHKRQQAMGNIVYLLGRGKKVYIDRGVTTFAYFSNLGVTVCPLESFDLSADFPEKNENISAIRAYFSEKNLIQSLDKIFRGG